MTAVCSKKGCVVITTCLLLDVKEKTNIFKLEENDRSESFVKDSSSAVATI